MERLNQDMIKMCKKYSCTKKELSAQSDKTYEFLLYAIPDVPIPLTPSEIMIGYKIAKRISEQRKINVK